MTASAGLGTQVPDPGARRVRAHVVVATLVLATLGYSMLQVMVVPAMPAIQRDLGAGPDATAWLLSAFLVSTAVATPVLGGFGDRVGTERVLMLVLVLFAAGSAVGAFATSLEALIVARAIQGLGGAVLPLAFVIARNALPPARVPVAIGIVSASFALGGSVGLVIGGPLVDHVSWHAIFWIGVALPLLAIPCLHAFVPSSRTTVRRRMDWVGALLLTGTLTPPLLGVSNAGVWGWGSARVLALLAAGLAIGALWVRWELRREAPLIDVRLLAHRSIWPLNAAAVCMGFGMYAGGYLVAQFVQADPATAGFGFAATVTGASLFLLPAFLTGLPASAGAGLLAARLGSRLPMLLGLALTAAGYAVLVAAHDLPWTVLLGTTLAQGVGLNLAYTAIANLLVQRAPAARTAETAGVNATSRTVGGALGSQLAGALVAASPGGPRGFVIAFALCGALLVVAIAVELAVGRRPAAR